MLNQELQVTGLATDIANAVGTTPIQPLNHLGDLIVVWCRISSIRSMEMRFLFLHDVGHAFGHAYIRTLRCDRR